MSDNDCTPTEYLIMEVLAARYRLGKVNWPIPTANKQALTRLEKRKWVCFTSHVAPGAFRVSLTAEGKEAWKLPPLTTHEPVFEADPRTLLGKHVNAHRGCPLLSWGD